MKYVLPLADEQATLATVGGKGASLARMAAAGLMVPDGFHVTTRAYRTFIAANDLQEPLLAALAEVDPVRPATLEDVSRRIKQLFREATIPPELAGAIVGAYGELPGSEPAVAVRSSATAEDLPEASFAGQQETFLNICGADDVLEATRQCWASLWTARAIDYRARQGIAAEDVALAVVVQRLVAAEAAGILFTANPINGHREEIVISAAWGLGEAVVGGTVTPDTVIVEKKSGRVLSRETADKAVMTTRGPAGTSEEPVPETLRRVPVLGDEAAAELAKLGAEIEALYGMPMDVEWTLADGAFSIVQARPITALPEPPVAPPTEWPLPDPQGRYMRTSIVELMPDPLSPLFATWGVPALNAALRRLVDRIAHKPEALPEDTLLTINGYAYMGVHYTARQWWDLATGLLPAFPRMLREGVDYWQDVALPEYRHVVEKWAARPLDDLSPTELVRGVDEIMHEAADHIGALQAGTLGAAAGSEGLFTAVYNKLIKRDGDPAPTTFLLGYESKPIRAEKDLYDLAAWSRAQPALCDYLQQAPTADIIERCAGDALPPDVPADVWSRWNEQFAAHLEEYGYVIYDMDFAQPLPVENPAPIVEMLKHYMRGEGSNPHERQQKLENERARAVINTKDRLRGPKAWAFRKTLSWAQKMAPLREDSIAEIGLGYPQVRAMLLELGRRLMAAGSLGAPEDIFWLERAEVAQAAVRLASDGHWEDLADVVQERRATWRARKQATPPPQLPYSKRLLGLEVDMFLAAEEGAGTDGQIAGVGASPGQVTAPARVLHGPEEFDQMQPGEVLVAGITTPAWTPLFGMAAAIVTDIGGPLSHGSIVAREYGIPAVLGTGVATRRIQTGQLITVDGSTGKVTLSENGH